MVANTDLTPLQDALGYHFKSEELLVQALTHSSYAYESRSKEIGDNNRLEFLGDSILGMIVADYLYDKCAAAPEGELTRQRALLVNRSYLSKRAKALTVDHFMLLGKGEKKTGGRLNATNLSGALEAIIAAIYIDGGIEVSRKFIVQKIIEA